MTINAQQNEGRWWHDETPTREQLLEARKRDRDIHFVQNQPNTKGGD